MKRSGVAPCQCHSPGGVWIVSPGWISMAFSPRAWMSPTPSVTCTVCPTECACQALRAPGREPNDADADTRRFLAAGDHVEPGIAGERFGRGLHRGCS